MCLQKYTYKFLGVQVAKPHDDAQLCTVLRDLFFVSDVFPRGSLSLQPAFFKRLADACSGCPMHKLALTRFFVNLSEFTLAGRTAQCCRNLRMRPLTCRIKWRTFELRFGAILARMLTSLSSLFLLRHWMTNTWALNTSSVLRSVVTSLSHSLPTSPCPRPVFRHRIVGRQCHSVLPYVVNKLMKQSGK